MSEYPIKKFDKLNRMVYVDWNGVERIINIYWDDTNKIKIKYRLWHNDYEVEAYNLKGKIIMKYSAGSFFLKLPRLTMKDNITSYIVDKNKITEWREKVAKKRI